MSPGPVTFKTTGAWEVKGRDLALPEVGVLQNHCVVKSVSSRLQIPCPTSSVFNWLSCPVANLPISKPAGVLQSESAKCRAEVRDLSRSVCTSLLENYGLFFKLLAL